MHDVTASLMTSTILDNQKLIIRMREVFHFIHKKVPHVYPVGPIYADQHMYHMASSSQWKAAIMTSSPRWSIHRNDRQKIHPEKVYFRSQILERPSIGEYWNISGVPVLPENLERDGVIQKLTILECKNSLVLSNTHIPVSGTWSILFPNYFCPA